ncbi:hypothetical protein MYSTI_03615 [Myxococcus stipitatus DSM 14675]|uniref:Uncharacterized protein n=1 Tax=Myxococcus stipitatus (strain DSM 14675 / JCM 12634 / Mx s8) TaxID=1278073 RepID=L7U7S4_MYXSD|nr:hypothetical protein [Myxococcus stipitatus]AGC44921.1 hypothetical protein MYSTI_03615 [Myxococcus stipitatus DSM 14675]
MTVQPPHEEELPTARELELDEASAAPTTRVLTPPGNEPLAMLARRGFQATVAPLDLPFPADVRGPRAEQLVDRLGHYAFRLFLRGAILRQGSFTPMEATRYLEPARATDFAEDLVAMDLAVREPEGRYRLRHPAASFGGTLEWYVAHELRVRFGFDVAAGVKFHAPDVGGDLDVVATAEGRLLYLEMKSSPPKHLAPDEVGAFFRRVRALRPHLSIFVMDTALRLSDKVLPLLQAELSTQPAPAPRRIQREIWALTPHLYVVNARQDLMGNIGVAVAEGLRALAPPAP